MVYRLMRRVLLAESSVLGRAIGHHAGLPAHVLNDRAAQRRPGNVRHMERTHIATALHKREHRELRRGWLTLGEVAIARLAADERLVSLDRALEHAGQWLARHR